MRSRTVFLTAGAVALGLLCGPALAAFQQDVTLRYRWTKGETTRYRFVQQSTTTISGIPGMDEMTIDQTSTQMIRTVADDVAADGTTTLSQAVESVRMEMVSPMATTKYDSENPGAASDPMSGMLKGVYSSMLGEPFTLVIAPNGEIKKVEGMSRLADKMFKNLSVDPASAGIVEGLKANLSDEGMKNMFMQAFSHFPDHPIKVGDTWTGKVTTANPMLGALTTSAMSTLKAVEGDGANRVAKIAVTLTMTQDPTKPAPPNPMGLVMQMGDSTGEAEHVFDLGAGRFQRSTTRLTMPMNMTGTGPDGSTMSMKTSIKSTTTVELVK